MGGGRRSSSIQTCHNANVRLAARLVARSDARQVPLSLSKYGHQVPPLPSSVTECGGASLDELLGRLPIEFQALIRSTNKQSTGTRRRAIEL